MEFEINNSKWKIILKDKDSLLDYYQKNNDSEATYVFGCTCYFKHEIYINKDMCYEQEISTLKHELTHCYIWMYGLGQNPNFTEEMVCDLVSAITNFINEIIDKYEKYKILNKEKK